MRRCPFRGPTSSAMFNESLNSSPISRDPGPVIAGEVRAGAAPAARSLGPAIVDHPLAELKIVEQLLLDRARVPRQVVAGPGQQRWRRYDT